MNFLKPVSSLEGLLNEYTGTSEWDVNHLLFELILTEVTLGHQT